MKLIELHILQSFPVSCLNRDDVGAPKTAVFGGVNRARISSQCLKRAARTYVKEHFGNLPFDGIRSRLIVPRLEGALAQAGVTDPRAKATEVAGLLSKIDPKNKSGDEVTTAVFLSPGEISSIAGDIAAGKEAKKAIKDARRLDAADIALFGRMIANDFSLNVEASAMFSHALSTHKTENDLDFFSSVDEVKAISGAEDAGASMIGTLEFASATYYRYCGLNLDLLARETHLGGLDQPARRAIVAAFLRAVIEAVPGARQNTMNAHVRPAYVLGTYKEKGQPVQLVNAFEKPVPSEGAGFIKNSILELETELEKLDAIWGIRPTFKAAIPTDGGIDHLLDSLSAYVA